MSIVHRIVEKVAQREGIDPVDVNPTLHDVVDIDSINAFSTDVKQRQRGRYPSVEFMYHGYAISVYGDGTIRVRDPLKLKDVAPKTAATRPTESGTQVRAMTAVADVMGARNLTFDEQLDYLLAEVADILRTESGTVSYAMEDTYVFEAVAGAVAAEIRTGETVPLAETVCKRVTETEEALVLDDVTADAPELADSVVEISSYIGVPLFVDGEVYGTFCFYSTSARSDAFTDSNLAVVELVSNWVSAELEKRTRDRALHASTTDRPYATG